MFWPFTKWAEQDRPREAALAELSAKSKRLWAEVDTLLDQAAASRTGKKRRMLKREADKLAEQAESADNAWILLLAQ